MRPLALLLLLAATAPATAQVPPPPEPAMGALLRQIKPEAMQAQVAQLAAFGTRHTASETTSETRGIGAARRWIETQWQACAKDTPLQIGTRSHIEPAGRRITVPTEIVNVVATLPGPRRAPWNPFT